MRKDKLKQNIIYNLAYQCLSVIFPLLTTPLISRVLGAELLGAYSYTYSVAYYFSLAAGLGICTYGKRLIAVNRDDRERVSRGFWELYAIQLSMSIAVLALYLVYAFLGKIGYRHIALLQGFVILTTAFDISWFLSGLEEFRAMVIRNTIIKLLSLVLLFRCVRSGGDLWKYTLIMAGTNCIGQLSVWPLAVKLLNAPCLRGMRIKQHIKPALKLFLPVIALNSYVLIDKVMLGMARTIVEVGFYENCDRLIRMPIGLSNAASAVMIPRAAYYIARGEEEKNKKSLLLTLKLNFFVLIPAIFGLCGIAPELVPWYFGEEFLPCVGLLRAMSPIILFMSLNNILRVQYFVAKQRDREYIASIVGAMLVNLVLNFCLVKRFGVYGVAAGSIVSEACASAYLIWRSRKELNYRGLVLPCLASLAAGAGMLGAIRMAGAEYGAGIITNIRQIVLGAGIYFAVCLICRLTAGYVGERLSGGKTVGEKNCRGKKLPGEKTVRGKRLSGKTAARETAVMEKGCHGKRLPGKSCIGKGNGNRRNGED